MEQITADICIYGATSAGIIAAVQGAKSGKTVILVDPGNHIGGMTTSGLSATDIGDKSSIGGLTRLFHKTLGEHYGTQEQWHFEPHIAAMVFQDWLRHDHIRIVTQSQLASVEKSPERRIMRIGMQNGISLTSQVYIDASYEGDLMAKAGVSCTIGREGNEVFDEHFSGIHFGSPHHNFLRFVDPYRKSGVPSSGLLEGISPTPPGANGAGDGSVQAYNFRVCITQTLKNRVPFPKPAQYNPERYELLRRYIEAGVFDIFNLAIPLPNGKADHNNWGAFNSDNIGQNYNWPKGSHEERGRIYDDHVTYQQGLFWFLANDERLPKKVRRIASGWGLAADEFTETRNWPPQLYVREARRMISDYILTEHDLLGKLQVEDPVGMGSYKMDSHNCRRIVKSGRAMNEGNFEVSPLSPYSIPYRSIRPKRSECVNLIVPVCISASHIAYCSVRMESVYMILGQSAALGACIAIDKTQGLVQDISYSDLARALQQEGQILREPEVSEEELEIEGKRFKAGQVPTENARGA